MSNNLYDKGRQKFLEAKIDWLNDTIKAILIDTDDYAVNLATHEFLNEVPVAARVSTSANLTGKTTTNGVADADDALFEAVVGDICEAVILIKDTGSVATSPLIAYLNSAESGLPITPSGGSDIILKWNNGPNKIFKL